MASQRPLIIPWLIEKINSQMYPGVEWVNNEKTQFRLPWKHARRQDLSEDDIRIFEDWAIDSGCYDPTRHNPDRARWKRNFRTALMQKDNIELVDNCSSNHADPHKVFEIKRRDNEVVPSESCAGTGDRAAFQQLGFNRNEAGDTVVSQQRFVSGQLEKLQLHQDNAALYCDLDVIEPFQETDYDISSTQILTEGAGVYSEGAIGGDVLPGVINEEQAGQAQLVQQQETFQQQILSHFTYNSFETDFEVNIYYRGTKVKSTTVTNQHGFCLTSRQEPLATGYLEDVTLPRPQDKVSDCLLIQAVNHILAYLDQGTVVEVRNGAICAKRLGNCRGFWTLTDTPTEFLPSPIDKNDYSVLYTLQQFVMELIEFVEKRREHSPKYSIWICLGETWPDSKPWRRKCIMVEIIPVVMRLLHELSYGTGVSSLSNTELNLEISDSVSSTNSIISLLRSIEEKMDW